MHESLTPYSYAEGIYPHTSLGRIWGEKVTDAKPKITSVGFTEGYKLEY